MYGTAKANEDGTYTVGNLVLATDNEAHLTYQKIQGTCNVHTEETVPPDVLVPGDDGFEWPDWWPWGPDGEGDGTDTGTDTGTNSGTTDPGTNTPTEPGGNQVPTEPTEPQIP